jgi:hypothetical protein
VGTSAAASIGKRIFPNTGAIRVVRFRKYAFKSAAFVVGMAAIVKTAADPALTTLGGITPEVVAQLVAPIIADSIPREYEGSKDWGKATRVTTGLHSDGNFFKFDIHRQKSKVNDGVWKKYKLTLVDPDKNLTVRIDNLRTLDSGRYALTLFVAAKIHGWARATVYERGVHVISLEGEGDTSIRLWLDTEIGIESVKTPSFLPGIAVDPVITDAKLKFDEFKLKRISDVKGAIAHDLGDLIRSALEKELSGPKLVAKLNRSIEKRRDRLQFTPEKLLGLSATQSKKNDPSPSATH